MWPETLYEIYFFCMSILSNKKVFRLWKIFLIPIFIFVLFHFLKDITQDLLGVKTILDRLGDAKEDLSSFSETIIWFYHWAMVNTFFMEIILLITVPLTWKRKTSSKIDYINLGFIVYIAIMFTVAVLLDPRY